MIRLGLLKNIRSVESLKNFERYKYNHLPCYNPLLPSAANMQRSAKILI